MSASDESYGEQRYPEGRFGFSDRQSQNGAGKTNAEMKHALESSQTVSETVATKTSRPGQKIHTRTTKTQVGGGAGVAYSQVVIEQTIYEDGELIGVANKVKVTSEDFDSTRSESVNQKSDGGTITESSSTQRVPGLTTKSWSRMTTLPDGTKESDAATSISGPVASDTETLRKTKITERPNGDVVKVETVSTGGSGKNATTTATVFDNASGQKQTTVTTARDGMKSDVRVTSTTQHAGLPPVDRLIQDREEQHKPAKPPEPTQKRVSVVEQPVPVPTPERPLVAVESERSEPVVSVMLPESASGDAGIDFTKTVRIPIALIGGD